MNPELINWFASITPGCIPTCNIGFFEGLFGETDGLTEIFKFSHFVKEPANEEPVKKTFKINLISHSNSLEDWKNSYQLKVEASYKTGVSYFDSKFDREMIMELIKEIKILGQIEKPLRNLKFIDHVRWMRSCLLIDLFVDAFESIHCQEAKDWIYMEGMCGLAERKLWARLNCLAAYLKSELSLAIFLNFLSEQKIFFEGLSFVDSLKSINLKTFAIHTIITKYTENHNYQEVESWLEKLQDKNIAYNLMVRELINQKKFDQAAEVASRIDDLERRKHAFQMIKG